MKYKTIVMLMATAMMCNASSAQAKGWLGKLIGGIAEAVAAPYVEKIAQVGGYSKDQAREFRKDLYDNIGASNANASLGVKYAEADSRTARMNAVKDILWNNSGLDQGKYGQTLSGVMQIVNIQSNYIEARQTAVTDDQLAEARKERDSNLVNVAFDMYEQAKERRAAYLAEKLKLKQQLMDKGLDPQLAMESAGMIISVCNNQKMSDAEKDEYLEAFGLKESKSEVYDAVAQVCTPGYTPEPEPTNIQPTAVQSADAPAVIVFPTADGFAFNQATLLPSIEAKLSKVATTLKHHPELQITITGYTCNIGSDEANKTVGLNRANAAKCYLEAQGIASERISVASGGKQNPLNGNENEAERAANRRVEITIQ